MLRARRGNFDGVRRSAADSADDNSRPCRRAVAASCPRGFGSRTASRSLVGCGENLPGQQLAIVDPKTCCQCADSDVGEIWIQGPSVASGYYDQPEATAAAFGGFLAATGEGPFLRTGDFGFLRNGQLFVTGRLKDLIIVRGRNFYPEDIEHSVERACDGLRAGHCAAFSIERGDRERVAIVQEVEPRRRHLDVEQALRDSLFGCGPARSGSLHDRPG